MSQLKTALPNADFVTEGYVDPVEPLRDEGPFGGHTGYYTLPEPVGSKYSCGLSEIEFQEAAEALASLYIPYGQKTHAASR